DLDRIYLLVDRPLHHFCDDAAADATGPVERYALHACPRDQTLAGLIELEIDDRVRQSSKWYAPDQRRIVVPRERDRRMDLSFAKLHRRTHAAVLAQKLYRIAAWR